MLVTRTKIPARGRAVLRGVQAVQAHRKVCTLDG